MFLYCVSSDYTDRYGLKKLGMTQYPVSRMKTYATGDPPGIGMEKRYEGLWNVRATTHVGGLGLERILHDQFASVRQRRANGNYTEWFAVSFEEVAAFLATQGFVIRQLSLAEIHEIHTRADSSHAEELELMTAPSVLTVTKENFLRIFGLSAFRRPQEEVWDRWASILATQSSYKGIVQWPTGTGKTIAELIVILLCYDHIRKAGGVYRGLLIAPKNDILNTQMKDIRKLAEFGLTIIEAHDGRFASSVFPHDKHILIIVTHAALALRPELTEEGEEAAAALEYDVGLNRLPSMSHINYDEVHRATGEQFFVALTKKREEWGDPYFTGTSATPKTSDKTQHAKLAQIFGDPYTMLHQIGIEEAVREGWVAQPRFCIAQIEDVPLEQKVLATIRQVICLMVRRIAIGMCQGGKAIAYFDTLAAVEIAHELARQEFPEEWSIYKATKDAAATDRAFVAAPADGTPRILFACDKYREGSDIKGLEFTAVLMGRSIAAYILLQIIGRALRLDYVGKEGWCCIVRPRFEDETAGDVLIHVLLDLEALISCSAGIATKKHVEAFVRTYFGTVTLDGRQLDVAETVARAQDMYLRRSYDPRPAKEKYGAICALNKEMGLSSRNEYFEQRVHHPRFVEDPKVYFCDQWISWYHFLGVDTSRFPPTKKEWVERTRALGLTKWADYTQQHGADLPMNPSEMYEDFTNWDRELALSEDHVW
jgi:superfamily II DNA or RNA helicase